MRFRPYRLFVSAAAILGFPFASVDAASEREITGREAEAIALAVNTFKNERHSRSGSNELIHPDLKHFTVSLERHGDQLEVIFGPDPSPRPKLPKNTYWLEFGGTTVYGSAVHYHVSLRRMKILRETFER